MKFPVEESAGILLVMIFTSIGSPALRPRQDWNSVVCWIRLLRVSTHFMLLFVDDEIAAYVFSVLSLPEPTSLTTVEHQVREFKGALQEARLRQPNSSIEERVRDALQALGSNDFSQQPVS